MTTFFFTLTLAALLAADPTPETPRKPHPLAPSLPKLTEAEEEKLDKIIDRFILYDLGKLPGAEGQQALQDFQKLGPEATFALIRGLNRAANIAGSCPAVVIEKKLRRIFEASKDLQLLEFARENVGLGVTEKRHRGLLQDLRVACLVRKNQVARLQAAGLLDTGPGTSSGTGGGGSVIKSVRQMTVEELVQAALGERGLRSQQVLQELDQRRGDEVIPALGKAAASADSEAQKTVRELLVKHLSRQNEAGLKAKLKDEEPEVRLAAIGVVSGKGLRLGKELIDLLADDQADVREAAQQALVKLNRGTDFGPARGADEQERDAAIQKWRAWWAKQSGP